MKWGMRRVRVRVEAVHQCCIMHAAGRSRPTQQRTWLLSSSAVKSDSTFSLTSTVTHRKGTVSEFKPDIPLVPVSALSLCVSSVFPFINGSLMILLFAVTQCASPWQPLSGKMYCRLRTCRTDHPQLTSPTTIYVSCRGWCGAHP